MAKKEEEWRPIPGYEGYYEVSDLGRVKSLPRRGTKGGILSPISKNNGYLTVALFKDGKSSKKQISRLVLEAFVGTPEGYMEACHNNGRRADNRLSNLRWDTHRKNIRDRERHGTTARGERNGNAKLTEDKVREIRDLRGKMTQRAIAILFGISKTVVNAIHHRRNWAHVY